MLPDTHAMHKVIGAIVTRYALDQKCGNTVVKNLQGMLMIISSGNLNGLKKLRSLKNSLPLTTCLVNGIYTFN